MGPETERERKGGELLPQRLTSAQRGRNKEIKKGEREREICTHK
jgi:hypothetical protein